MKNAHQNRRATVVIGSGFGDEGKGLMTDYFVSAFGKDAIVARFNGGAQAGHTVVLPDGRRHIHSHFASGTLSGAATYLSRFFVSNPLLFFKEKAEIVRLSDSNPQVFADERGFVSTPYDMLINQFVEEARGAKRHGSCGIGFGETIERCENSRFTTRLKDLKDTGKLAYRLLEIRQNWVPPRLQKLGLDALSAEQQALLDSSDLLDNFLETAARFYQEIEIAPPQILTTRPAILEGAQGLLLDQEYGWFPHVTRSFTGLKNALELASEAGLTELGVTYATRSYLTRHGAGPLPGELAEKPSEKIVDLTNVPNPHQGTLRFAHLDLDLLGNAINADLERNRTVDLKISPSLAVTCLDQLDENAAFVKERKLRQTTSENLLAKAAEATGLKQVYVSRGQTRETITNIEF